MSEAEQPPRQLWYVRRDERVLGPYPSRQVVRYLILGRLRIADEVSLDQIGWAPMQEVPGLLPDELRHGADEQALSLLRLREDERRAGDRRDGQDEVPPEIAERRSGQERRRPEAPLLVRHRKSRTELLRLRRAARESYRWRWAGLAGAVLLILGFGIWLVPPPKRDLPRCDAPPGPRVNWSNCRLESLRLGRADLTAARIRNADLREADLFAAKLAGADLAYTDLAEAKMGYANLTAADLMGANLHKADLAYANLAKADLSYADLTGAVLGGAILDGTRLDNAVWIDGRVCKAPSVGRCN